MIMVPVFSYTDLWAMREYMRERERAKRKGEKVRIVYPTLVSAIP